MRMRSIENGVGVLISNRALHSRENCVARSESIFGRNHHILCVLSDETMKVVHDAVCS